ncbi:MAG: glycosyltransferase [Gemmatimonadota bacterium]
MTSRMPVALQQCDVFVARTMNWNYDHLRSVPRYRVVVCAEVLQNRDEFPLLETFRLDGDALAPRIWNRIRPAVLYPPYAARLRRYRPRVLHSHMGYVATRGMPLQAALDVPWLVSFHGADVYLNPQLRAARYVELFRRVSRVLALGPTMVAALTAMGCPQEKIAIHSLGVDVGALPVRPRHRSPGDRLEILFAGTFCERKGLPYLLDAAKLLRDRGVRFRLTVVGEVGGRPQDWAAKEAIEQRLARYDFGDCVRRLPYLRFAELIELGLSCHVLVAPSVTAADGDMEGIPVVIQQMMATAMPVVTTHHSDIPYLFGPHRQLLLPERDATAIADRLQAYAEDPELARRHGEWFRERIVEAFDVRHCAAALARHYDEVAG